MGFDLKAVFADARDGSHRVLRESGLGVPNGNGSPNVDVGPQPDFDFLSGLSEAGRCFGNVHFWPQSVAHRCGAEAALW